METVVAIGVIAASLISVGVSIAAYRHVTRKVPIVQIPIQGDDHAVRGQAAHIQAVLEIKRLLKQAKIKSTKLDEMLDSWLHHASERLAEWMEEHTYEPTVFVNHKRPLPEWGKGNSRSGDVS